MGLYHISGWMVPESETGSVTLSMTWTTLTVNGKRYITVITPLTAVVLVVNMEWTISVSLTTSLRAGSSRRAWDVEATSVNNCIKFSLVQVTIVVHVSCSKFHSWPYDRICSLSDAVSLPASNQQKNRRTNNLSLYGYGIGAYLYIPIFVRHYFMNSTCSLWRPRNCNWFGSTLATGTVATQWQNVDL